MSNQKIYKPLPLCSPRIKLLKENGDILIPCTLDYAGEPCKDGTAHVSYNGYSGVANFYKGKIHFTVKNKNSSQNPISKRVCQVCSGTGKMPIRGGGIILGTQQCAACGGLGYIAVPSYWP